MMKPKMMTFEEYALSRGHAPSVPSFPELHRTPRRPSKTASRKADHRVQKELEAWGKRQSELRKEYQEQISSGEIVEPTITDRLMKRALGVGETAEAARRALARRKNMEGNSNIPVPRTKTQFGEDCPENINDAEQVRLWTLHMKPEEKLIVET